MSLDSALEIEGGDKNTRETGESNQQKGIHLKINCIRLPLSHLLCKFIRSTEKYIQ